MLYYIYDKTFEGLLSGVWHVFYRKEMPVKLISSENEIPLFTDVFMVVSEPDKAERVLAGLAKKASRSAIYMLHVCFLAESAAVENTIFRYICKAFQSIQSIEMNFVDPDVMELSKIYKKVLREEEHVRQFVRFQKTSDDVFFACVEPRYNVIPLSLSFFKDRFADQQWLIYDVKRQCGWYYDLEKTEEVRFENPIFDMNTGKLGDDIIADEEVDFRQLWKLYFKSICIKERINLKLQRQHLPKRFWKYLTEKQ